MIKRIKLASLIIISFLSACSSVTENIYTDKISSFNAGNFINNEISGEINFSSFFSVKANTNGIQPKSINEIKSIRVYLIRNSSSSFPAGGDPLNASNIVSGPLTINIPNITNNIKFSFKNVPASTNSFGSGNYYFFAVRAYDDINATGNEIIKVNNNGTAWTGTTASAPRVAVSNGTGIQVRTNDLAVSSTTPLPVTLNLEDGQGSSIDTFLQINGREPERIKSFKFHLCTDATKPVSTRVSGSTVTVDNDNISNIGNKLYFSYKNILPGTYYVTVEAFDGTAGTGERIIEPNNGSTPFASPDTGTNIAVSSNQVVINSNLNLSFLPSTPTYFDVNLKSSLLIKTISGTGVESFSGDGGQATSAGLAQVRGLAIDNSNNLYVADQNNNRIRKITPSGAITTVAGNGTSGFLGDGGQATSAQLNLPEGVAVDSTGNIYIADTQNHRIRKVSTSGIITTIAGNGSQAFSGDGGQATSAELNLPYDLAISSAGDIYISDHGNFRIRKVNVSGVISTFAGTGTNGYNGEGLSATLADFTNPFGIEFDKVGNLFVGEAYGHRVRKISNSGIVTTVAGNGVQGDSGESGQATSAQIFNPDNITFDRYGMLYFSDSGNSKIKKVDHNGIIKTIAGTSQGFSGDGNIASSAQLHFPRGIVFDSNGSLFISDLNNYRVRKVY